jgi:hypothetical protein
MRRTTLSLWALAGALGLAACNNNTVGPNDNLQVSDSTDAFAFSDGLLAQDTQTLTYTWQNTGTIADVHQTSAVTSGSPNLTIRDNDGKPVYVTTLSDTGSFQTSAGAAGAWTVELDLQGVSGYLQFDLTTH